MEAFEQFVAVAMAAEGLVVSPAIKFPVSRRTKKQAYEETQTHGYEVDLVGARTDRLVLATVKSFFGSKGVTAVSVCGRDTKNAGAYRLLNDNVIRDGVIQFAAVTYGYEVEQVFLRLYVGKFSGKDEDLVRSWCGDQHLPSGPIEVFNVAQVVDKVKQQAGKTEYVDNASIVALKVLEAAGELKLPKSGRKIGS